MGFGSLRTTRRTPAGSEAMAMVRREQVHKVGGRNMKAQVAFIAGLFGVTAQRGRLLPLSTAYVNIYDRLDGLPDI